MTNRFLLLLATLTPLASHAQDLGVDDDIPTERMRLRAVEAKTCEEWEVDLFGRAVHPRKGALPSPYVEHNGGVAFRCMREARPWLGLTFTPSFFGGGLRNSQDGTAIVLGATLDATVLSLPGYRALTQVSFHLGVSPTYIEYERRDHTVTRGIVPIPHQAISFAFDGRSPFTKVTLVEQRLGQGIVLRHVILARKF